MEWALAVVALTLIAVGVVSRRIDGTPVTPAIIFVGVGLLVGTRALDLLDISPTGEGVKLLAEATLTVVLFADASRIDLRTLRREYAVPARLLGIGLPLTIALGALLAAAFFGALSVPEALVLAVLLAPLLTGWRAASMTESAFPCCSSCLRSPKQMPARWVQGTLCGSSSRRSGSGSSEVLPQAWSRLQRSDSARAGAS